MTRAREAPARRRVVEVLCAAAGHRAVSELAAAAGVSVQTVRYLLRDLDASGLVDADVGSWPYRYQLREAPSG